MNDMERLTAAALAENERIQAATFHGVLGRIAVALEELVALKKMRQRDHRAQKGK